MAHDTVHEDNQHKWREKRWTTQTLQEKGDQPRCSQRVKSVPVSYIM